MLSRSRSEVLKVVYYPLELIYWGNKSWIYQYPLFMALFQEPQAPQWIFVDPLLIMCNNYYSLPMLQKFQSSAQLQLT